jgi:DNA repair protein SbcD/Mre11
MRFLHLADVHLGFQQYGLKERFNDFGFAFERAITYGLREHVDAILIAGDLFHKSAIEPSAFLQATKALHSTRDAEIPVIVIEGNHDQIRYRDQNSWLDVLNSEGYINLLRADFPQDACCNLAPWDEKTHKGAYIDIQNVRIVGLQWLGASVPAMFPDFVNSLSQLPRSTVNFTVLLTHAALEGEIENVPIYLNDDQLQPLQTLVNYLALGHLHKPFEKNDWAYNPGSLEVYDFSEIRWTKGWYDVIISPEGNKKVTQIESEQRPFYSETLSVDLYPDSASIYRGLTDLVRKRSRVWMKHKDLPVIEIQLRGNLNFDRVDLDLKRIEEIVRKEASVCHVVINASRMSSPGFQTTEVESLSTDELELSVLSQLAQSDSRFASQPDYWAKSILTIKRMALEDCTPEEILSTLQSQIDSLEGESHDH